LEVWPVIEHSSAGDYPGEISVLNAEQSNVLIVEVTRPAEYDNITIVYISSDGLETEFITDPSTKVFKPVCDGDHTEVDIVAPIDYGGVDICDGWKGEDILFSFIISCIPSCVDNVEEGTTESTAASPVAQPAESPSPGPICETVSFTVSDTEYPDSTDPLNAYSALDSVRDVIADEVIEISSCDENDGFKVTFNQLWKGCLEGDECDQYSDYDSISWWRLIRESENGFECGVKGEEVPYASTIEYEAQCGETVLLAIHDGQFGNSDATNTFGCDGWQNNPSKVMLLEIEFTCSGRRMHEESFKLASGHESGEELEDVELEDVPYCVSEDFPCEGEEENMVYVCHYSGRDGYRTFCVPEADSDLLRFYPFDYCGPCEGGYGGA
jgi:hypothetical protein